MSAPLDARIAERRAHLTKQRAERKDPVDLTLSPNERRAYAADTMRIDQQIAALDAAAAKTFFPTLDANVKWRDNLVAWREALNAELLAMHPRIRNEKELDQKLALEWSIKLIDK